MNAPASQTVVDCTATYPSGEVVSPNDEIDITLYDGGLAMTGHVDSILYKGLHGTIVAAVKVKFRGFEACFLVNDGVWGDHRPVKKIGNFAV